MALESLLTRLIAPIAKAKTRDYLESHYAPPTFNDILHDGLVSSGETWGGILGGAAGAVGGEILGGPSGAAAGGVAGASAGTLAGGWAGHGAYREGQLIKEILLHPDNWAVDAAGAIVPVMQNPATPSNDAAIGADAAPDPFSPDAARAGGLLGIIQDYMRSKAPGSPDHVDSPATQRDPTLANSPQPFRTGGQLGPGSASSSRPLYNAQPFVPSADAGAPAAPAKPIRRLSSPLIDGFDPFAARVSAPSVRPNEPQAPSGVPSFDDRFATWASSSSGSAPLDPYQVPQPAQATGPLGVVSGQPMPNYPVPPPIWGFPDSSEPPGRKPWSGAKLRRPNWPGR